MTNKQNSRESKSCRMTYSVQNHAIVNFITRDHHSTI